jgi:hypothetical protein
LPLCEQGKHFTSPGLVVGPRVGAWHYIAPTGANRNVGEINAEKDFLSVRLEKILLHIKRGRLVLTASIGLRFRQSVSGFLELVVDPGDQIAPLRSISKKQKLGGEVCG